MNTIGLAINSDSPDLDLLQRCVVSGRRFDEIKLYVQNAPDDVIAFNCLGVPLTIDRGCERIGIVDGFNWAANMLTTDWMCTFCDDDYFIDDHLGLVLAGIRSDMFYQYDVIHYQVTLDDGNVWGSAIQDLDQLKRYNCLPHGSIFRKQVFRNLNGYKCPVATDWEFWLRAYAHGYKFKFLHLPVYHFTATRDGALSDQLKRAGSYHAMRDMVLASAGLT